MGGVGNLAGLVPDNNVTPTCLNPACERVTALNGDAEVGVEYSYFLDVSAFVSQLIFAPSRLPAIGSVTARAESSGVHRSRHGVHPG